MECQSNLGKSVNELTLFSITLSGNADANVEHWAQIERFSEIEFFLSSADLSDVGSDEHIFDDRQFERRS